MSDAIGPGDVVVCVFSRPEPDGYEVPVVGGAYTVRFVLAKGEPHPASGEPAPGDGLAVNEIIWRNPDGFPVFPVEAFAKAGRRGMFDILLDVDTPTQAPSDLVDA